MKTKEANGRKFAQQKRQYGFDPSELSEQELKYRRENLLLQQSKAR
jgi:hypothetical protein